MVMLASIKNNVGKSEPDHAATYMQAIRQANVNSIKVGVCEQLFVGPIAARDAAVNNTKGGL
eukprot:406025-Pelagomonas_calceolata.AAC.1